MNQIVFLFIDLAIVLVLARVLGALAKKVDQPAVIGEVLAGILLGPTLLGEGISGALFPVDVRPFLTALASVGVAVFMFAVGAELDRGLLRGKGRVAATVSLTSIAVPFTLGSVLALYLALNHDVENRLAFILFIGAAMSVTAFPVLARMLTDRGMSRTAVGGIALTCAAVDDLLAWCLLAVVVLVSGGGAAQWLIVLSPVYLAVMLWVVRPLLRKVFTPDRSAGAALPVLLAGLLVSGAITELIGLHFIFGAFFFGLIVPHEETAALRGAMLERIGEFNATLLLPVFFIVAGLKVDLSTLGATDLMELVLVLVVAISGKFGGAYLAARLNRLPARQAAALGVLMNTRGLTELIILSVGLQLGVLDQALYSIMVVMAITTTAMAGPLLWVVYPTSAVDHDLDVERARQGTAP